MDRGLPALTPMAPPESLFASAGFAKLLHATINDGVSRALASNPYSSQVVAAIPAWMHSVLGRDFARFMDAFAGLPGGSTHEGFSSGRVPYELGVYLMEVGRRERKTATYGLGRVDGMGWGE